MYKTVFMYAGQGSQKVSMGKDLYENFDEFREVIDSLTLSDKVKKLIQEENIEVLSKTENTQPVMAAFSAGVTTVLSKNGIKADAALGLSLGEYGALFAAGVYDSDTYVNIVNLRGQVMSKAAMGAPECSMSAILGLGANDVLEGCQKSEDRGFVTVANYNCPGQYVICGDEAAVEKTEEYLREKGAKRCIRLQVSGPFHTRYMESAGTALKKYIDTIPFEQPNIDVLLNVTGDYYKPQDDLKKMLELQVKSSVHFEDSIRRLISSGYENFVEIGPGNALSGFVKKTARDMKVPVSIFQIETAENLKEYIDLRKGK